jgi:hypothetical protein
MMIRGDENKIFVLTLNRSLMRRCVDLFWFSFFEAFGRVKGHYPRQSGGDYTCWGVSRERDKIMGFAGFLRGTF